MFEVRKERFGKHDAYKLYNDQTHEYVSILPSLGGIINDINIQIGEEYINIIDGYDAKMTQAEIDMQFKGSKLSPYPNRIKEGKYNFEGVDYQLDLNFPHEGHSIHGLLIHSSFEVIERAVSPLFASLLLRYDYKGDQAGYPFPYRIKMLYTFHAEEGLTVLTMIKNRGEQPLPLGDGWHPYFKIGDNLGALDLKFAALDQLLVDDRMIPTGETKPFQDFKDWQKIADYAFDTCFVLDKEKERHSLELYAEEQKLTLKIWQETGEQKYNYLQLYIPADRRSLAVEPMSCPPNAFNNQMDLIHLAPQKSVTLSWGLQYKIQ